MRKRAFIPLVVMTDLKGVSGPLTLHVGPGRPALAICGVAPVYLCRDDAARDWPGAVIVRVTADLPDISPPNPGTVPAVSASEE